MAHFLTINDQLPQHVNVKNYPLAPGGGSVLGPRDPIPTIAILKGQQLNF